MRLSFTDWRASALLVSLIYGFWAYCLLTNFDFRLIAPEKLSLIYNDVAYRLMHGDVTVSPEVVGFEAYIHDGKTYSYFGIFPAMLRMPLVAFGGRTLDVARISCLASLFLNALVTGRIIEVSLASRRVSRGSQLPIVLGGIFAGPGIYLLASASVYHEVIFWAVTFTLCFALIVIRASSEDREISQSEFVQLSTLAGLCLLTRVNAGAALYTCLALLLVHRAVVDIRPNRLKIGEFIPPAIIAALFFGFQLLLNDLRWGRFTTFSPWTFYKQFMDHPDRMAILNSHGAFSFLRVLYAIGYYGVGFDPRQVGRSFYLDYYGDVEGPRSAFVVCEPLFLIFFLAGVLLLLKNIRGNTRMLIMLAGLSIGPLVMLGLPFLAVRYTYDAWGVLVVGASAAIRLMPPVRGSYNLATAVAAWGLLSIGLIGSHLTLLRYKINYSGTDPATRYELSQLLQPVVCPRQPLREVKLTDFNPLITERCPPLW